MTRINVVPVQELSDQWLIAEYRELPRVIKGDFNLKNAPERYTLGKGHVKWAKRYACWTMTRYFELCDEMEYRGFKISNSAGNLYELWNGKGDIYYVSMADIFIKRWRIGLYNKSRYFSIQWTSL